MALAIHQTLDQKTIVLERMRVETELAALAQSGAATLVGLMVSDGWTQVKENFAHLFGHGQVDDAMMGRLEGSRSQAVAAAARGDQDEIADIEAEWQIRLRRLLRAEPTAAEQLLSLVGQSGARTVYNINRGNVRFGSVIQAGYISGDIFGSGDRPEDA